MLAETPLLPVGVQLDAPFKAMDTVPLAWVMRTDTLPTVAAPALAISPPEIATDWSNVAGCMTEGNPVNPKVAALLVPVPMHKSNVTSFPTRAQVAVHVTAAVNPV